MKALWAAVIALWLATVLNIVMIERGLNVFNDRLENIENAN
jgi:hypothetical protein